MVSAAFSTVAFHTSAAILSSSNHFLFSPKRHLHPLWSDRHFSSKLPNKLFARINLHSYRSMPAEKIQKIEKRKTYVEPTTIPSFSRIYSFTASSLNLENSFGFKPNASITAKLYGHPFLGEQQYAKLPQHVTF